MSPLRSQEPDSFPETTEMISCGVEEESLLVLSCNSLLVPKNREGVSVGGRGYCIHRPCEVIQEMPYAQRAWFPCCGCSWHLGPGCVFPRWAGQR